jgi:hypothetical protein
MLCKSENTKPSKLPTFLLYAKLPFVKIWPVTPIDRKVKSISISNGKEVTACKEIVPVLAKTLAPFLILIILNRPF